MSGYREITVRVLAAEHDTEEVRHGLMEMAVHDASLGAYSEERDVLPNDPAWAAIIHDREDIPSSPDLTLTLPRADLALLMDTIARCEQGQKLTIDDGMVNELSRIASDLGQQADAQ